MGAGRNFFHRWWTLPKIGYEIKAIWGMSVKLCTPARSRLQGGAPRFESPIDTQLFGILNVKYGGIGMQTMEVFDPSGATEVVNLHARRLGTLAGKTVALLSDDMWQAHRMLPLLREKLQAQYPDATFIPETEFPMGTRQMDTEETVDMLVARGVNAVIVGNAS